MEIKNIKIGNGQPKICLPLTGTTKEQLIEQAKRTQTTTADIIEWRVDKYYREDREIEDILATLEDLSTYLNGKLLLFTFRSIEEGGEKEISLSAYHDLCLAGAKNPSVDLIDIELAKTEFLGRTFIQQLKAENVKIIMSSHDFEKTPKDGELIYQIGVMNQMGADIGKIAAMPQNLQDVLRMMNIISRAKAFNKLPIAAISMGELGKISRIAGEITGSVLTFGTLEEIENSAPGQISIEELQFTMEILHLSDRG
ncbi:MAG TPA: type I 3-dehydroquinate dehydratase [Tetragenococcus sp.]|nr:type I 3-dehydroquinate dehydratase [Tetragenococcus sp.]